MFATHSRPTPTGPARKPRPREPEAGFTSQVAESSGPTGALTLGGAPTGGPGPDGPVDNWRRAVKLGRVSRFGPDSAESALLGEVGCAGASVNPRIRYALFQMILPNLARRLARIR
jgi:hypothetical protein